MYFTDTPFLNSMEAMMIRPPCGVQRGGGKNRNPYKYTKKDCDCKFCLYHRKKDGCAAPVSPVLDTLLSCGAASFCEAVKSAFSEVKHIPFQRRLSKISQRKDDGAMIFQNSDHQRIFGTEKQNLYKPINRSLAALYLLTADHPLWIETKRYIDRGGKLDLKSVHLGDISTDGYALWKAVKELQTGEKEISLCELSDSNIISDRVFRFM